MKETQPVQRPRFDTEKFTPRGQAEMQNCIWLERFVELFEFSRDPGIVDWQHGAFEFDAEVRQSRLMFAQCTDQQRRWVVTGARKSSQTGDENAQWRRFYARAIRAGLLHDHRNLQNISPFVHQERDKSCKMYVVYRFLIYCALVYVACAAFILLGRWSVRSFNELQKRWDDHVSRGRYHPGLAINDAGLVLGADRFQCHGQDAFRRQLISNLCFFSLEFEGVPRMPDSPARQPDFSFSASAEDYIRRFMKVAEETMPNANLVPVMTWHISGKFTNKVTGEVRTLGPGIGVGAIDPNDLADEPFVPMGRIKVAIRLPDELQSADRLKFDFLDGSFVVAKNRCPKLCAVLPRRRPVCMASRILDTFGGQKWAARKAKCRTRALLDFCKIRCVHPRL
jgi:hypothetical protein